MLAPSGSVLKKELCRVSRNSLPVQVERRLRREKPANVVYVHRREMESFLAQHRTVLPARIWTAMLIAHNRRGIQPFLERQVSQEQPEGVTESVSPRTSWKCST